MEEQIKIDWEKKFNDLSSSVETIKISTEAILKQREVDLTLARAMENNSIVNLRLTETFIMDKDFVKGLMEIVAESIKRQAK